MYKFLRNNGGYVQGSGKTAAKKQLIPDKPVPFVR